MDEGIKVLDDDEILELLGKGKSKPKPKSQHKGPYRPNPQKGPLRFFDKEMRCANRGCGSPTHLKVEGIQRCMAHALDRLNEMLVERGVLE